MKIRLIGDDISPEIPRGAIGPELKVIWYCAESNKAVWFAFDGKEYVVYPGDYEFVEKKEAKDE